MAYTDLQRLAVGQYLMNRLGDELKRGAGGVRDAADAAITEAYEADGTDRRAIVIGGRKVGSLSLTAKPAEPEQTGARLTVTNYDEFEAWLSKAGDTLRAWVLEDCDRADELAGWALVACGERAAGTEFEEVVTRPARPASTATRLTVDAQAIEAALPELRAGVLGELGAGNGD